MTLNRPYEVDTNDVINVVSCLLDDYEFVFVSKVEGKSDSFFIVSNNAPSTSYGVLDWLNWSGPLVPVNPYAYYGSGGILGNIYGYSAAQYPGPRINEGNLLPFYLPLVIPESIYCYGNLLAPLIPGSIAQFGPPPIIPSETTRDISRISPGNGYFNSLYPGSFFPANLLTPSF